MAPATSGNAALAVAALALLVAGNACSPSPPQPVPEKPQLSTVCLGEPPAEWTAAWKDRAIKLAHGTTFGVSAIAGDLAFGQVDIDGKAGVGYLDLSSARLTMISPYAPGVSGLGWLSVDRPWVVWEQLNSITNLGDWSVHAYNLNTGNSFRLATGAQVPGRQPMPVVRDGVAAWSQPVAGQGAEIVAVDLAGRQTRKLATGRVGSPVYAGAVLAWSEMDSDGRFSLVSVDARTFQPAHLPPSSIGAGGVGYLAGSPGHLAWSSQDSSELTVMHLPGGVTRTYKLADRRHHFQFLQLAGDFLVWYSGITSSVLDLTTGKGFDIAGTATGSPEWIATSIPQNSVAGITYSVTRLPTNAAGRISRCADQGS